MSARLTEEQEWFDLLTEVADGINRDNEPSPWDRLIADRAAILESERDLLAALEAMVAFHVTDDDPDMLWDCDKRAVAALANAHKQDAPTGAGGGA